MVVVDLACWDSFAVVAAVALPFLAVEVAVVALQVVEPVVVVAAAGE